MEQLLKNKVAVITGGSRGLGLAIAQTYARAGAKVVIASRSQASVLYALDVLKAEGSQAVGMACDVANLQQVEELAELAIKSFGRIDIWVNNAGVSGPYGPTAHVPASDFSSVINTNIIGTYNGSVTALRYMLSQKSGKLINLLGRGDTGSIIFQNAYTSSKVWVRNFTKTLANEYQKSGVDIFGFNPGLVRTDMLGQVQAIAGFEEKVKSIRVIAALWGNEADIPAQQALLLASSHTDGKNGKMYKVLTPIFMLRRLFTTGLPMLFHTPVRLMELNISTVEPILDPVLIDNRKY